MEPVPELEQLIGWVDREDRDPLSLLTDAVIVSGRLGEVGDDLIDHFVQEARRSGASWADIGSALGVSKQAAQKRFVRRPSGFRGSRRGLFTRFASEARSVVTKAVECAHYLGSTEIGTLHLVAGLTERAGERIEKLIEDVSEGVETINAAANVALGEPVEDAPTKGHIPFAPESKKVLELSLREAIHADSRHIGSEHILLGILRDEKSAGARLLNDHGLSHETVQSWLEENPAGDG